MKSLVTFLVVMMPATVLADSFCGQPIVHSKRIVRRVVSDVPYVDQNAKQVVQQFHYFGVPSQMPYGFQQQVQLGAIERQFQRLQDQLEVVQQYSQQQQSYTQQYAPPAYPPQQQPACPPCPVCPPCPHTNYQPQPQQAPCSACQLQQQQQQNGYWTPNGNPQPQQQYPQQGYPHYQQPPQPHYQQPAPQQQSLQNESYVQRQLPQASVVTNNCAQCHTGPDAKGRLDMSDLASLTVEQKMSMMQAAIDGSMPKGGRQLSQQELQQMQFELFAPRASAAAGVGQ